jgi:CheY-like chemotaxis protein
MKKVAIVDDEPSLCQVFSYLVKKMGYDSVFVANDGAEIVRAVLNHEIDPDVIIMDYRMPKMDGLEAAKRILDGKPSTRIIIVSADDSIRSETRTLGLIFAQKPLSLSKLRDLIQRTIEV